MCAIADLAYISSKWCVSLRCADQTVMSGVIRGLRQANALPSFVKSEPSFAAVQRRCMSGEPRQYVAEKDFAGSFLLNIRAFERPTC